MNISDLLNLAQSAKKLPGFGYFKLRDAREAQKLTRKQLAQQVGCSEHQIRKWEDGQSLSTITQHLTNIGIALNYPTPTDFIN